MLSQEKPKFTLPFEKPIKELEEHLNSLRHKSDASNVDLSTEIKAMEVKLKATQKEVYSKLSAWDRIQLARHPQRPYSLDYIQSVFEDFQELHGDRAFRDDAAVVGGTAFLDGQPVIVLGQQKGRNTKENIFRNFGYPHPEGYRKALRLMKMAERFKIPVISIIDTAGAFPGIGAEERHVAEAIAVNLREMSCLGVPIVAVVIGEGGSGGALGVGVADRVLILENAYYSVISPEGCAAILWKDRAFAPQAAEALKITAGQLKELGVVDRVIAEPMGGAHTN
ncbi:MAG TPA: acetyl-CoA carboxylase carboxyltransferase subunit alpha, partial [Opitutales bacterium]|nr:acetyl-CoA carboxylase carboxyltransferase subunit alpha [Opitutales bacterium]